MLITCPNCEASYTVADTALGEKGRSVRCAKCKEVWHAAPPAPAMAEPAVEEWQPSVDEWKPSTDEWQPSTDEWKPSVEEWQPTTDQPSADQPPADPAAAMADLTTTGDAAWPQPDAAYANDPPHVDDAPPVVPAQSGEAHVEAVATGSAGYDAVRRRKAARKQAQKERGFGITAGRIAAALAGILVALFVARESIVRVFPQTASLYGLFGFNINVRGLEFGGLTTAFETQDGTRVLFVEGDIRNISRAIQPVASLRYALRNAAGVEVYSWTGVPDRNLVPPGEMTHFRTRLASPPNDGRDVRISFVPSEASAPQKH